MLRSGSTNYSTKTKWYGAAWSVKNSKLKLVHSLFLWHNQSGRHFEAPFTKQDSDLDLPRQRYWLWKLGLRL